jgi:hypothetical protein
MRGGRIAAGALALCLGACSAPASAPEGPLPVRPEPAAAKPRPEPVPDFRLKETDPAPGPEQVPGGGGIKGGVVPVKTEAVPAKREPTAEDVLRTQRELVARQPQNDEEKLRLALLLASRGDLDEAEGVLSRVRTKNGRLLPYLDFFLRRELGDHQEAARLLARFNEEDRAAAGFSIQRAELVSRVRRFRDFTPAEHDKIPPGGIVHVYVEPRNFKMEQVQGKHILHLRYEWKLFDDRSVEHPVPAWERATPGEREDRIAAGGPFTEFYQSFRLPLPANLAMGHYRVQVTVTDAHSGKQDRVFIPIYVTPVELPR